MREEIDFWRNLIEDRKKHRKEPPNIRMWEALAYAEHKLKVYLATRHLHKDPDPD